MGMVYKGRVLSVEENKCRVAPFEDIDQVSAKLLIPDTIGELKKDDAVAYTVFQDYSGVVLAKL
ncbi:MAG: hypothetical protein K6G60_08345 [Lachnospiraceae bacterium]|nr:hypothetical protein [Lachnospiraceae bacterium]